MNKQDLMDLANRVRDGKATQEEKLKLLQELNLELKEAESILKQAQKGDKKL